MKKKNKCLIIVTIIIVLLIIGIVIINKTNILGKKATNLKETKGVTIVPTMSDIITKDSSWCGTFQLVWNDMKNNVVKNDIVFTPQEKMADNLNKEEFKQDLISVKYNFVLNRLEKIGYKVQ